MTERSTQRGQEKMRVRFCIDWDGTCVTDAWPAMGQWNPGAIEALRSLSKWGEVVIFTCRVAPYQLDERTPRNPIFDITGIREMLNKEGLHDVRLWDKAYKPSALVYVDNRAVRFNGRPNSWKKLVPKLIALSKKEGSLDAATNLLLEEIEGVPV